MLLKEVDAFLSGKGPITRMEFAFFAAAVAALVEDLKRELEQARHQCDFYPVNEVDEQAAEEGEECWVLLGPREAEEEAVRAGIYEARFCSPRGKPRDSIMIEIPNVTLGVPESGSWSLLHLKDVFVVLPTFRFS